jgi:hypothetical protein
MLREKTYKLRNEEKESLGISLKKNIPVDKKSRHPSERYHHEAVCQLLQ